jgi:hypothetical protein
MTNVFQGLVRCGTFLITVCLLGHVLIGCRSRMQPPKGAQSMIQDARTYPSARENPTVYPGARPPQAYLLEGTRIRLINFTKADDIHSAQILLEDGTSVSLDDRLRQLGAVGLEDRIAVIGYGSNRNPGQILKKWSDARGRKDAKAKGFDQVQDIVPVLKGTLENVDVVVEQFTSYGTVYAGIFESPQTKGQRTEVWLTLLDPVQLRIMNASEGIHGKQPDYKMAVFPGYNIDGFRGTISPLGYAGDSRIFKSRTHNSPIVFAGVLSSGGNRLPRYDAVGALQLILQEGNITEKVFDLSGEKTVPGLMHWINTEWNSDPVRQQTGAVNPNTKYVRVSKIISDYIDSSSIQFKLADEKEKQGLVISTETADSAPPKFTLGSLLRNAQAASK